MFAAPKAFVFLFIGVLPTTCVKTDLFSIPDKMMAAIKNSDGQQAEIAPPVSDMQTFFSIARK
jgi:hypothetical protein